MRKRLVVAALLVSACSTSTTLNTTQLEQAIEDWFQSGAQIGTTVTCPADVPLKQGDVFRCTAVTNDGLTLTVQVTQTDASGGVAWQQVPNS